VIIRSIEFSGFMRAPQKKPARFELPESGVVLVTGENGAGKSSVAEAVACGLWGKSLRGASGWRAEEPGEVIVDCAAVLTYRKRTKSGKQDLSWSAWRDGTAEPAQQFENASKAQDALAAFIGDFDVWRRTHVFSSADAAHFTLATDAERKRFLEVVLGLDRFDAALERCREDKKKADRTARDTQERLASVEAEQRTAAELLDQRKRDLADLPPPADASELRAHRGVVGAESTAAGQRLQAAQRAVSEAERALGRLEGEANAHARAVLEASKSKVCPSCKRPLPAGQQAAVPPGPNGAELHGTLDAVRAAQAERQAAQEADRSVAGRIREIDSKLAELERAAQQRAKLEKELKQLEKRHKEARAGILDAQDEHDAAMHDLALLATCEQVLGLRGVRAHVLASTLGGMEAIANGWLARVAGPDLTLKLESFTEKKSGGVSDAISLDVRGAGGGQGYRGASAGERRRIDVALLLALAEVSAAAAGRSPGTLFFDEVFDALDPPGVEAVAECLVELAQSRAVVVISHSRQLGSALGRERVAASWQIADGRIA
jgi:DNA repair exonuclease SbcCD ATPase subunit